jgi:hypothetical protein
MARTTHNHQFAICPSLGKFPRRDEWTSKVKASISHCVPSLDFSQKPVMVLPLSLKVPVNRCEKPGDALHIFQTPSLKLISRIRETPRESK